MAKPTELTLPKFISSTNVPSAEKLQFTSSLQPTKIVVYPAVNRGNAKDLRNLGNKRKKEKNDSESRKIYSIVSAIGAVVTVVAVIILFTHL